MGAGFGAVVRTTAQLNGKTPEKTLGQAIGKGFVSGGLFLAAVGFLAGFVIGLQSPAFEIGVFMLAVMAICVLSLMIAATAFAGIAYFCCWLGLRGTGLLLALAIVLAFTGIQA